jgi:hypothetical protein
MQPIYNKDHLIIGLKAKTDPKKVKEKFKRSENHMVLIRVED